MDDQWENIFADDLQDINMEVKFDTNAVSSNSYHGRRKRI